MSYDTHYCWVLVEALLMMLGSRIHSFLTTEVEARNNFLRTARSNRCDIIHNTDWSEVSAARTVVATEGSKADGTLGRLSALVGMRNSNSTWSAVNIHLNLLGTMFAAFESTDFSVHDFLIRIDRLRNWF